MTSWKDVRDQLNITPDEESVIELEKDLIRTMVCLREEKGLSQADLADMINVKQPVISRMEKAVHSPQINSLLKVLVPLGYKIQIVPIEKDPDPTVTSPSR